MIPVAPAVPGNVPLNEIRLIPSERGQAQLVIGNKIFQKKSEKRTIDHVVTTRNWSCKDTSCKVRAQSKHHVVFTVNRYYRLWNLTQALITPRPSIFITPRPCHGVDRVWVGPKKLERWIEKIWTGKIWIEKIWTGKIWIEKIWIWIIWIGKIWVEWEPGIPYDNIFKFRIIIKSEMTKW